MNPDFNVWYLLIGITLTLTGLWLFGSILYNIIYAFFYGEDEGREF